jgi:act minimal PKS acyl carrier protein
MKDDRLTIDQLRTILLEAAGEPELSGTDDDIEDTEFTDLGYDSISLLEAAGRIERDCGVRLDDDLIVSARTPRALLAVVNERLAAAS